MAGTNLKFTMSPELPRRILKALGFRKVGKLPRHAFPERLCLKNGAPTSSTAVDSPGAKNVICLDEANDNVYICTSYTGSGTHTWTKITN